MIVPSIDLRGGRAVQLVGGAGPALDAGDPRTWMRRFAPVGEVAVVDLDAALGEGSNRELVAELCRAGDVRVGGGVRDLDTARAWLDLGAARVVIGTAARVDLLRQLPRERVVAALDARHGEVVVDGWRSPTGRTVQERMRELAPHVGGFLVTFVEREGRLQGTNLDLAADLVELAGDARVTIAGGVTTPEEVAALDRLGADAQVGMALYTGRFGLADALAACLVSDRADGLWPTLVVDEAGRSLGLCWSSRRSLRRALESGRGWYESRRRGLWEKGAGSGAVQELVAVDLDCDRDALRFTVRQHGDGFCHLGTWTCFGADRGLPRLERRLRERMQHAPPGSYSARLLAEPGLLAAKLREEADELARARGPVEVREEAADLLYFALARLAAADVPLASVERTLDLRERRVSRRPGDAKVDPNAAPGAPS